MAAPEPGGNGVAGVNWQTTGEAWVVRVESYSTAFVEVAKASLPPDVLRAIRKEATERAGLNGIGLNGNGTAPKERTPEELLKWKADRQQRQQAVLGRFEAAEKAAESARGEAELHRREAARWRAEAEAAVKRADNMAENYRRESRRLPCGHCGHHESVDSAGVRYCGLCPDLVDLDRFRAARRGT